MPVQSRPFIRLAFRSIVILPIRERVAVRRTRRFTDVPLQVGEDIPASATGSNQTRIRQHLDDG